MRSSSRALYRSRQVIQALWPRIHSGDLESARRLMSTAEARLFDGMERRDQRHALEVVRRLQTEVADRDVLVAALLHDCGKGDVPVWVRILHVAAPRLGAALGREDAHGWRGAAYRLHQHEARSVRLMQEAGCSERALGFVSGTHSPEDAWLAERLRAADDAS